MQREAISGGARLFIATEGPDIRRIARLARRATAAQFADTAVHAELWRWLRLDARDPAYRRDGLTADCLGLRGSSLLVARLTLPPVRMRQLTRWGVHHLLALDTERVVRRSAALCLLTVPATGREVLVQAGRVLLRTWLVACGAGLTTHPISALLDCTATTDPTMHVFGAVDQAPVAVFRLGFTRPTVRSPRLPLAELVAPYTEAKPAALQPGNT